MNVRQLRSAFVPEAVRFFWILLGDKQKVYSRKIKLLSGEEAWSFAALVSPPLDGSRRRELQCHVVDEHYSTLNALVFHH
jgi:hypothetical protein